MFNKKDDKFALVWAKKIKGAKLLGGKCEYCGDTDIFHLDFHHSGDKEFSIMSRKLSRWSDIEDEIKKCHLLCRNCHSELHCDTNGRRNGQKKQLVESIGKTKCEECGYKGKNYASLDFHHLGSDKKFEISNGLTSSHGVIVTVQELMDEISKCEILCRNCHAIKHTSVDRFNRLKDLIMQKVDSYKELQKPLDRCIIMKMCESGKGVCQIAKELKCAKSTISMIITKYKMGNCVSQA